ncbi:UBP-type zinc finger domain-containing protein [Microbacterium gorillae]|uniref:UBP-type zinc finger domain-containing protein n=1 Tax=Microbacterium gorillae TaxID=1231063 RepID=UPI00058F637C|nr:UBP-type zinc finger domain-containing protein [Microbacterium gorillae]
MDTIEGIDPTAAPSGDGCAECLASEDGWWVALRRCAQCGHIGCCDSSPGQHATAHFHETGHPLMRSFEPGQDWWWDYRTEQTLASGPDLAPPTARSASQTSPGPADRLPDNWRSLIVH